MSTFPLDQYDALRNGCGIVELAGWSSVTFTGADRQTFLNNFCTNDVKRLVPGESCEAFFTNVKGKILGHGLVTCREAELVFITVPGQATDAHRASWTATSSAKTSQLRDTTAERALFADCRCGDGGGSCGLAAVDWIRWDLLGTPRCAAPAKHAPADLPARAQMLQDRGAIACDEVAFDALRIEAGTPLFGVDFDETTFRRKSAATTARSASPRVATSVRRRSPGSTHWGT